MLLVDALVRISAITMLVVLAITAVRDIRPSRSWPYLVLASLSTATLYCNLTSPELAPPAGLSLILGFLNVPHLIFVWLFALSVFQTKFRLSPWHAIIGLFYTFPIFWFRTYQFDLSPPTPVLLTIFASIGSMLLMAHLVWVILRERDTDLMEARKRSRLSFVAVLVIVAVLTAVVDLYLIAVWPNWARLIKATTMWPAVAAAFLWIVHASKDNFVTDNFAKAMSPAENQIGAKEQPLYQQLLKRVKIDHIYLDPSLTIAELAKDLGVTSHRLRALINQSLGYENFNQFLNAHRIQSILSKLDDQNNDHLPILTIALDAGFQSLAPFNRAFKEIVGQTPSQYRKSNHRR